MPYTTNKDLPDSIKNSLPTGAQDIWRNAFNSAAKQFPGDEERANKIGWAAIKNAGWAKDTQGNWVKSNSELRDVEVFSVGLHKGINFNEADLDNMVTNFYALKDKIKPVFKLAHENNMHKRDGQPALGWASGLKRIGNKLLATFTDVPKLVKDAIDKKLYKRVSSEIYDDLNIGGKKYKRVLAGVGLLGADIPVVKNLEDIEIFFAGDNQTVSTYTMDVNNGVIMEMEEFDMTDELKKTFDERLKLIEDSHAMQLQKFTEERESDLKKFTEDRDKVLADKNKELEDLKAANAKRESEGKIAEFITFCESEVKNGRMAPAARDILVEDIDKMNFAEGQEMSVPFGKFKKYQEKTGTILDKTEHGFYLSPEKRTKPKATKYAEKPGVIFENTNIDEKATAYMKENKVDYSEALQSVLESDPALLKQFSEAGVLSREEG